MRRKLVEFCLPVMALALGLSQHSACAQNNNFWLNSAGGNWNTNANWSLGAPPPSNGLLTASDDAVFNLGSALGYTVTLPGGTLYPDRLNIETDKVTLTGGGIDNAVSFLIGASAGQVGSLTLTPGATLSNYIGPDQIGTFDGTGVGHLLVNGAQMFPTHSGIKVYSGTMSLTNSANIQLANGDNFIIGGGTGSAAVSFDKAGMQINGGTVIGANGSLSLTNGADYGSNGLGGETDVNGGTAITPTTLTIDHSSMGTFEFITYKAFRVGDAGYGAVTVKNGGSFSTTGLALGGAGGNGNFTVTGLNSTAGISVAVLVGTDFQSSAGTGLFQLDNHAIGTMGDMTIAAGGTLKVLSGAVLNAHSIDLSNAGALDFTGGTVSLTGGAMTVATYSVPSTTTLKGVGSVTGNVTNGGAVAPGDAPGIITIGGNYIQTPGGTLYIGLGGTVAGSQYDQLDVVGSASLAGTLDVYDLDNFVPSIGQQFTLFTAGSHSGAFSALILPQPAGGGVWNTSALYTNGIISVVPEPAMPCTLTLAGATLLLVRRRRRLRGRILC